MVPRIGRGPFCGAGDFSLCAAPPVNSPVRCLSGRGFHGFLEAGGGFRSEGVLLRSENDGTSFSAHTIPGANNNLQPWLSAIHPSDPDKLYVRLRGPDSGPDEPVENR